MYASFCRLLMCFRVNFKKRKKKTGTPSECLIISFGFRLDPVFVSPDLVPNCLKEFSTEDTIYYAKSD